MMGSSLLLHSVNLSWLPTTTAGSSVPTTLYLYKSSGKEKNVKPPLNYVRRVSLKNRWYEERKPSTKFTSPDCRNTTLNSPVLISSEKGTKGENWRENVKKRINRQVLTKKHDNPEQVEEEEAAPTNQPPPPVKTLERGKRSEQQAAQETHTQANFHTQITQLTE